MNDSRQLIDDCQTVMCLLTIKCLFRTEALALDLTSGRVSGVGVWLMCVICNFFFYFREKTASSLCTALWPTFFFIESPSRLVCLPIMVCTPLSIPLNPLLFIFSPISSIGIWLGGGGGLNAPLPLQGVSEKNCVFFKNFLHALPEFCDWLIRDVCGCLLLVSHYFLMIDDSPLPA